MIMDDVIPADTGEVVLLKVNYQRALQLEGDSPPAVGYCVMRRPGGLLLALPRDFLPSDVLQEATLDGFTGVLGPSTITSAPAVELAEAGDWVGVYPARSIDLLLADFADPALSGIELLEEGLSSCVPFVAENAHLFPLATAVVEFASVWAGVQGDRGAGYVTAEEMIPDQAAPPCWSDGPRLQRKHGRSRRSQVWRPSRWRLFEPCRR